MIVEVGALSPPIVLHDTHDLRSWIYWSPDGKRLSYFNDSSTVLISKDGKNKIFLPSPDGKGKIMSWANDGSTIYAASCSGGFIRTYKISLSTSTIKLVSKYKSNLILSGTTAYSLFGSLTPDGNSLITSAGTSRSDIWIMEGFPQPQ